MTGILGEISKGKRFDPAISSINKAILDRILEGIKIPQHYVRGRDSIYYYRSVQNQHAVLTVVHERMYIRVFLWSDQELSLLDPDCISKARQFLQELWKDK